MNTNTEPMTEIDLLLVEDDEAHAKLIRRKLATSKFTINVRCADSLRTMSCEIEENMPDFLILDYLLPDGRSIDVLTTLPSLKETPTVLVSSFLSEHMAEDAQFSGFRQVIEKSEAGLDELLSIISAEFSSGDDD